MPTRKVGECAGITIAQHRAQSAQRAGPGAQGAHAIAGFDLAGMGQREALAGRLAAMEARHLLAQRIHEHRRVVDVHGAEVGIGLAADRIERDRALRRVEAGECADHGGEVAAGIGEGLVEGRAHGPLVGRQGQEGRSKGVLRRQRQGEEDVVGVVGERRREEREVTGDTGVGAGDAAVRSKDRVGRAVGVAARRRHHLHRAALDRRRAADIDAVALARVVDLDLVGRARHLGVGAVHR